MGWLTMPFSSMGGHKTATAYLDAQFTWENADENGAIKGYKVLASSCPGNRVYYAAVQETVDGVQKSIFAAICLVHWSPRSKTGEQFGYKDMTEHAGPNEARCPRHILDLLTPTDNAYALDWRRRCLDHLRRRARPVEDGDRIRLAEPLRFTDGLECAEFIVVKQGRKLRFRHPESHGLYRISRFRERDWSIVPVPKIHKMLAA